MILLLAGLLALAQDPGPPSDVFADEDVHVEIAGDQWRITVRGRVLEVAVPETPDERALVDALVSSLLAELSLAPRVPRPPPVPTPAPPPRPAPATTPRPSRAPRPLVVAPDAHAESAPPQEPEARDAIEGREAPEAHEAPDEVEDPEQILPEPPLQLTEPLVPALPPLHVWLAGAASFRAQIAAAAGVGIGAHLGRRGGVRARVGFELPRATRFVADSRARAVRVDLAAWRDFGPLRAELGPGLSLRNYGLADEPPTRHVVPVGTAGVGAMLRFGSVTLAPWVGATVDAAVTRFDLPGDDEAVLSPVEAWAELRVGWRP